MSDWTLVALGDLAADSPNALATGPFGSSIGSRYFVNAGVPVIRGSNLSLDVGSRLVERGFAFLEPAKAAEFSRSVARRGDLVFTCWGTVGQVGLIDNRAKFDEYIVSNKQMKLTPNADRVDSLFLYYQLASPQMVEAVLQRAIGAAVPGFNLGQLRELPVDLPPIEEQHGIAATLGALDDKIESNRRQQEAAQSLLRAHVTRIVSSHQGATAPLAAYCRLIKDGVATNEIDSRSNYIGFDSMPRGQIFLTDWSTAEGIGSNKWRFQVGDVLFGKLRPYFKKVGIAPVDGVCSTDILVIRPIRLEDTALVAIVASSDALIDKLSAAATGTRMPRASWSDLAVWQVPELNNDERDALTNVAQPLIERMTLLTHETKRLIKIRDTLLPELLSGRIGVPEAERIAPGANV